MGKGVSKAVDNLNKEIAPALLVGSAQPHTHRQTAAQQRAASKPPHMRSRQALQCVDLLWDVGLKACVTHVTRPSTSQAEPQFVSCLCAASLCMK